MAAVAARTRSNARATARAASGSRVTLNGGAIALPRRGLYGLGELGRKAWRIPDTPIVEGISRGRLWIAVLAVLLFGIVALNVSLLKVNANISSTAIKTKVIEQQNAKLRAKAARLSSPDRILRAASKRGMAAPAPQSIRYLPTYPKPTAADRSAVYRAASLGGN